MNRLSCAALVCFIQFVAVAAHAVDVSIQTRRQDDAIIVEATAEFASRMEDAWAVLTDYDHLSQFIPNMESSRIVGRHPAGPVIEQKGVARLLLFRYPLVIRLAVMEFPPYRIVSRGAGGSFKYFRGVYDLSVIEGRTHLHYTCEMVPDFFIPPFLGTAVLRHNVEESFGALAHEIVRRSAASRPAQNPSDRATNAR